MYSLYLRFAVFFQPRDGTGRESFEAGHTDWWVEWLKQLVRNTLKLYIMYVETNKYK